MIFYVVYNKNMDNLSREYGDLLHENEKLRNDYASLDERLGVLRSHNKEN